MVATSLELGLGWFWHSHQTDSWKKRLMSQNVKNLRVGDFVVSDGRWRLISKATWFSSRATDTDAVVLPHNHKGINLYLWLLLISAVLPSQMLSTRGLRLAGWMIELSNSPSCRWSASRPQWSSKSVWFKWKIQKAHNPNWTRIGSYKLLPSHHRNRGSSIWGGLGCSWWSNSGTWCLCPWTSWWACCTAWRSSNEKWRPSFHQTSMTSWNSGDLISPFRLWTWTARRRSRRADHCSGSACQCPCSLVEKRKNRLTQDGRKLCLALLNWSVLSRHLKDQLGGERGIVRKFTSWRDQPRVNDWSRLWHFKRKLLRSINFFLQVQLFLALIRAKRKIDWSTFLQMELEFHRFIVH